MSNVRHGICRNKTEILIIPIGIFLLAARISSALPAVIPLKANARPVHATQANFVDRGQQLGGDVETSAVALGDLDGDGDLDAVVASFGGSSRVYFNQGGDQGGVAGIFVDSGQTLSPAAAVDVELQDLDA